MQIDAGANQIRGKNSEAECANGRIWFQTLKPIDQDLTDDSNSSTFRGKAPYPDLLSIRAVLLPNFVR